jgi:hypothetical protein
MHGQWGLNVKTRGLMRGRGKLQIHQHKGNVSKGLYGRSRTFNNSQFRHPAKVNS